MAFDKTLGLNRRLTWGSNTAVSTSHATGAPLGSRSSLNGHGGQRNKSHDNGRDLHCGFVVAKMLVV